MAFFNLFMLTAIAGFFVNFPHELAVFLVAMTPVLEQRVALPLAILVYRMPVFEAFIITIVGNLIPVLLLLFFADNFHAWVQKNSDSFFAKHWLNKLRQAQDSFARYERYGLIGLTLFIISPIPGSGIFTGTLIAFLMGVPFRRSWAYITLAVIGSAAVALLLSIGAERLIY